MKKLQTHSLLFCETGAHFDKMCYGNNRKEKYPYRERIVLAGRVCVMRDSLQRHDEKTNRLSRFTLNTTFFS